jgi:hypothetical protein
VRPGGPEESSAETVGYLDARAHSVDLRSKARIDRVRSPHDRHTYERP